MASDAKADAGLPGLPHFAPKAKRVIYLFQHGMPPRSLSSICSTISPKLQRSGVEPICRIRCETDNASPA